jgi:hypothetical protein
MDWIITKDCINTRAGELPRAGQGMRSGVYHRWTTEEVNAEVPKMPYEFRLLDGDREVYYEGRCGDITDAYESAAFAPEDWAAGDGVVETQYRKVGAAVWRTL